MIWNVKQVLNQNKVEMSMEKQITGVSAEKI